MTDRSWRRNPVKLERGRPPQQYPKYTILRALVVMAVTLRSGKRQSAAICGRARLRRPSPHLCEAKAVATALKALDVRAEVLHRHRGSSAAEDGHKHAFNTSLF